MYFLNSLKLIPGYFTHVTTLAEVKEQVLKYIPVMARPMVMYRDKHPIQWTGVYADIEVRLIYFKFINIKRLLLTFPSHPIFFEGPMNKEKCRHN